MSDELFKFWCDPKLVNHLDGCDDGAYVITKGEMKEVLKSYDKLVDLNRKLADSLDLILNKKIACDLECEGIDVYKLLSECGIERGR